MLVAVGDGEASESSVDVASDSSSLDEVATAELDGDGVMSVGGATATGDDEEEDVVVIVVVVVVWTGTGMADAVLTLEL